MRQSFFCIYDSQFRTVYFPSEFETTTTYGHYPWEFAEPEFVETIKESFSKCRDTQTPQFHVAKLAVNTERHAGLYICAWLTPVSLNTGCSLFQNAEHFCEVPCASIIAKCVLVPPEYHLLTPREREVLAKLAAGVCQNDITTAFNISRSTVDTLIQRVRKKFEFETSLQVAVWATTYRDLLELDPQVCRDHLYKL